MSERNIISNEFSNVYGVFSATYLYTSIFKVMEDMLRESFTVFWTK